MDTIEKRIAADAPPTVTETKRGAKIKGYFCLFGAVYDMGWFLEKVDPDAFRNCDYTDVRCLFNHNISIILGRTPKTLKVGFDSRGGWYECDLPKGPNGQDVAEAISRGDISQSSWAFELNEADGTGDIWEKIPGRLPVRTLTDIARIGDVSPVSYAANPSTTVEIAQRSYEAWTSTTTEPGDYLAQHAARQRQIAEMERSITAVTVAPEYQRRKNELKRLERDTADLRQWIDSTHSREAHGRRLADMEAMIRGLGLPANYFNN